MPPLRRAWRPYRQAALAPAVCRPVQTRLNLLQAPRLQRWRWISYPANNLERKSGAMLNIVAILLVLTATFSYVNQRFLKWPMTIGVMAIALAVSLAVVGLDELGIATPRGAEHQLLASIDFADVLMQGMLSFLLFAGALHVEINQLRRVAWQVAALAVLGTALLTLLIGYASWLLLSALGIPIPLVYCLLFGALISPTDPIAVLSVLKSAHGSPRVEATTPARRS